MLRNTHPQVDELIATLKGEIGSEIQRNGAVSHNAINHREKALHSDTLRATNVAPKRAEIGRCMSDIACRKLVPAVPVTRSSRRH